MDQRIILSTCPNKENPYQRLLFASHRCVVALISAHQQLRELLWAAGIDVCSYVQPGKPYRLQSTQGCGGQNVTSRTNCCELFAELKCHKNASIMTWHWSTKYDVFVLDGMYGKKGYQFVLKERWYHSHLILQHNNIMKVNILPMITYIHLWILPF